MAHNIHCFNKAAACLLTHLYESFPRPVEIDPYEFEQDMICNDRLEKACQWENSNPNHSMMEETLRYLANENIIRHNGVVDSSYYDIVLTSKGFTFLNKPMAKAGSGTVGESLKTYSRNVKKAITNQAISTLFEWMAKG